MTVAHNHGVKSQLAKLLAMENLTVQHRSDIKTAMFDVQARVLYLPVWKEMSNDLYDLLVVHEVGHALDTPVDGWMESIRDIARRVTGKATQRSVRAAKGFLNVIEDARIDKRQKRRYPGARRNYINGYKELLENDFFGTKTRDINSMIFIDRINVHFKGGVAAGVKFSPEEMKFVKRIEDAETFEEVIQLTEEVFAFAKEEMDQPRGTPQEDFEDDEPGDASEWEFDEDEDEEGEGSSGKGRGGESDEDGEESDGDSDGDDSDEDAEAGENKNKGKGQKEDGESDEDGDGDSDGEDDGDEDGDADAGEQGSGDYNDSKGGKGISSGDSSDDEDDEDEGNIPESETERQWEEKSQNLVVSSDTDYQYLTLPTPNLRAILHDYKDVMSEMKRDVSRFDQVWHAARTASMTKWKTAENSTISYLVKEFETRKAADTYSKIQVAKTGVINTNKLHSYRYNEDIFRRNTVVPAGKNHGFVMFLDWSGSMNWNIDNTMKQLYTLVLFCKRVQIPFEVYTFRDPTRFEVNYDPLYGNPGHDHNKDVQSHWTFKKNSVVFDPFKLRNILSSRMSAAELNQMMSYLFETSRAPLNCDPMGGTPLNSALAVAPIIVEEFQKRTKVQIVNTIVLTDGDSCGIQEIHGTRRGTLPANGKRYTSYFLEDEKLKKNYNLGRTAAGYSLSGIDQHGVTTTLLQRLKERTGCNLVGFYLTNSSFSNEFRSQYGWGTDANFEKAMADCWKANGFFPVSNKGYDKYFILSSDSFRVTKPILKIDEKMTKNTIAKNFIKYSAGKKVNRVLLRQFIDEIAS